MDRVSVRPCVRAGGPVNLYRAEFTTDVSVLCGGDGGSAICVGYGTFLTCLTYATAYRNPDLAESVHDGGLTGETPVRPVLAIPIG